MVHNKAFFFFKPSLTLSFLESFFISGSISFAMSQILILEVVFYQPEFFHWVLVKNSTTASRLVLRWHMVATQRLVWRPLHSEEVITMDDLNVPKFYT